MTVPAYLKKAYQTWVNQLDLVLPHPPNRVAHGGVLVPNAREHFDDVVADPRAFLPEVHYSDHPVHEMISHENAFCVLYSPYRDPLFVAEHGRGSLITEVALKTTLPRILDDDLVYQRDDQAEPRRFGLLSNSMILIPRLSWYRYNYEIPSVTRLLKNTSVALMSSIESTVSFFEYESSKSHKSKEPHMPSIMKSKVLYPLLAAANDRETNAQRTVIVTNPSVRHEVPGTNTLFANIVCDALQKTRGHIKKIVFCNLDYSTRMCLDLALAELSRPNASDESRVSQQ